MESRLLITHHFILKCTLEQMAMCTKGQVWKSRLLGWWLRFTFLAFSRPSYSENLPSKQKPESRRLEQWKSTLWDILTTDKDNHNIAQVLPGYSLDTFQPNIVWFSPECLEDISLWLFDTKKFTGYTDYIFTDSLFIELSWSVSGTLSVYLSIMFWSLSSPVCYYFWSEPNTPRSLVSPFRLIPGLTQFPASLLSPLVCWTFLLCPHLHNHYLSCIM